MLFDPGGFLCEPWVALVSILFYQNAGMEFNKICNSRALQSILRDGRTVV